MQVSEFKTREIKFSNSNCTALIILARTEPAAHLAAEKFLESVNEKFNRNFGLGADLLELEEGIYFANIKHD